MTDTASGSVTSGVQRAGIAAKKKQEFDPQLVSDISEKVYRRRLNDECGPGADTRMVANDEDDGKKLRGRARAYDPLTRTYMRVLGVGSAGQSGDRTDVNEWDSLLKQETNK